ncbi:hypothetical protein AU512_07135 [Lonsdalea iberica]|uniref:Uncharacterized protein n=1 Tax=Lonsdalea iberica TaxID=1082703 RepID=A0ABX3XGG5_9GAMM|nr:hypothetical protein [Lonsdalea iberica]OSN10673.1 hypothetical protein AU512_07135 [Lonsdalea iberica]
MSFYVGTGDFLADISSEKTNDILASETAPEMSLREKIRAFFAQLTGQKRRSVSINFAIPPPERPQSKRLKQLMTYPGFEYQFKALVNAPHRSGASDYAIEDEKPRKCY